MCKHHAAKALGDSLCDAAMPRNQPILLQDWGHPVTCTFRDLFEGIQQRTGSASFHVWAQFLEIYNEDVQDLLHPEIPSKVWPHAQV